MFTLSVECGLSVLNYPYITTPEPYWLPTAPTNPTTPTNPTSYVTTESATEIPASTLESETVPEPQSTTDDTFSGKSVETTKQLKLIYLNPLRATF